MWIIQIIAPGISATETIQRNSGSIELTRGNNEMKIKLWLCVIGLLVYVNTSQAVPITSLVALDDPVEVGDLFSVEVRVDGDNIGEELLSFGFNLLPVSPLLSYLGFSIGPLFSDDISFGPDNVSALAFPGIPEESVILATLNFSALSTGIATIAIEGLFDAQFGGLFYETSGFDIEAQTQIRIIERSATVSAPGTLTLLAGLLALGMRRRCSGSQV